MSPQLARLFTDDTPTIPDRLYFRIGDVARLCGVEPYVLRFWETQFPQLKPNKSGSGQRLYRRRDVEMALEIKRLVHDAGYTIHGARQSLEQARQSREPQFSLPLVESEMAAPASPVQSRSPEQSRDEVAALLDHARSELREIAALLSAPAPHPVHRRARLTTITSAAPMLFPS